MPTHPRQQKPKLGQNFLVDPGVRRQIVDALGDISAATVLEIGPGQGALTGLLAARAGRLIAVELDRTLAPRLTSQWGGAAHVRIVEADILALDLRRFSPEGGRLTVVGNLPYYITSDILLYLFAHAADIDRAVLMVQEEVADRLAAHIGTSEFGVLSATAQLHGKVEKLFTVPPESFAPAPGVNSAVMRIAMCPRFEEFGVDRSGFMKFIQRAFQQKRKTLANNLKSAGIDDSTRIAEALRAAGLDAWIRAEAVPLEAMAQLYRTLSKNA